MDMEFTRKLPVPAQIKRRYALPEEYAHIKENREKEIKGIFEGNNDKLLLIIGPCSADRHDSVLEYIYKLRELQEKVKDKIFIIPRIYTNKPRTTGEGYKGMLHQPNPDEAPDMLSGLISIRKMHIDAIAQTGFTCADEMLYPENHRYLSDLLAYVAVGARSVEDQQHRLTASGLGIPVGMKNPTSGDYSVMLNAIKAAHSSHTFIYRGWEAVSKGNPHAHAILRGYVNEFGQSYPNYHFEDLIRLAECYNTEHFENPSVIIDTNHSNSGKQYLEQIRICKEVLHSCRHSNDIKKLVKGFMVESYLVDGCQKVGGTTYGQSITDPCLGWKKTERLVLDITDLI